MGVLMGLGQSTAKVIRSNVRAGSGPAEGVRVRMGGEGSGHFSFGPLLHAFSRAHRMRYFLHISI